MTEPRADVIVIGSGASGVHAAWPLVEAGLDVVMVDIGTRAPAALAPPPRDFTTLRTSDDDQQRYFLGEQLEGIPLGPVRVGAQLTPPRQYVTREAARLLPVVSGAFSAALSSAVGGLAAAWGASTMPFLDSEMRGWPITRADLQPHYDRVAERIGICGPGRDALSRWTGPMTSLLPPAPTDANGLSILKRAKANREALRRLRLWVGRPRLALATRAHRGRGPLQQLDMEFWGDADRSVWRPAYTLEELLAFRNFRYDDGLLVTRLREDGDAGMIVDACGIDGGAAVELRARRVVLAAGAIGSARVVMSSLGRYNEPVSFVCNPYTYYPCLNLPRLGARPEDARHSLTQVTMIGAPDGPDGRLFQPQVYSYRSLLLFKLLKDSPLSMRESIPVLQRLQDAFTIVGVFHEDHPAAGKHVMLRRGAETRFDHVEVAWKAAPGQRETIARDEARLLRGMRMMGLWALKRLDPGDGASIHYAGTLPMAASDSNALTCDANGRLRAMPRVLVADGAALPHLPSKGLTFTLMAHADRVGSLLAAELAR